MFKVTSAGRRDHYCPRTKSTAPAIGRRSQSSTKPSTGPPPNAPQGHRGAGVLAHCAKKPPWSRSSTLPTAAQLSAPSRAELRLHLGLRPPRTGEISKGQGRRQQLTTALSRIPPSWLQPARESTARWAEIDPRDGSDPRRRRATGRGLGHLFLSQPIAIGLRVDPKRAGSPARP